MKRQTVIAALMITAVGCLDTKISYVEKKSSMAQKTIEQVQEDHTDEWMSIPGVVGTAIGETQGKPCILILTSANQEQIKKSIPESVENYPVIVQYVGKIESR